MQKILSYLIIIVFLTSACTLAGQQTPPENTSPAPTTQQPTPTDSPAQASDQNQPIFSEDVLEMEDIAEMDLEGNPLTREQSSLFTGSGNCTTCHSNLTDQGGNDVSIDTQWRGSMMANAARDPYFQAAVRREIEDLPELREFIEDKCSTCHMPIARTEAKASDLSGQMFGSGFNNQEHYLHELAYDGVTCTVCHQIQPDNFGAPDSFSGNFMIDQERPQGQRYLFGPYQINERLSAVMAGPSGFIPQKALHIQQAELCATCHTLFTPSVNQDDEVVGEFPEQVPYLEWLESDYPGQQTCQDCHMPPADGGVILANTGGPPRSPFSRHLFMGANSYILRILRKFGDELNVTASSADFEDKIAVTLGLLENDTADIEISAGEWTGNFLQAQINLENKAGHKLPSGFPSRRVWIHFVVLDARGRILFESGKFDSTGRILDNDNDLDPGKYERHYEMITEPDQVQIYEPVLVNDLGELTTHLLRVESYIKDNRLLPSGFEKTNALEAVSVNGQALADENFLGGGDEIVYRIELEDAQGPLTVQAEVLLQTIGYRWAENHRLEDIVESETFMHFYDQTPNWPVVLAQDSIQVELGP